MINFPNFGIRLGGVDIGNLLVTIFNIMLEKNVLTENELVGYLTKAGFTFTVSKPQPVDPIVENKLIHKHENGCICEECQRNKGLQ